MKIRDLTLCAMFAALMALCAWIALPLGAVHVTLQTFALYLALCLLGGKLGSAACGVYILLGAVGLPVFSGFRGGIGMLLGASGGYIWGFLASALVYWLVTAMLGTRRGVQLSAMILSLFTCYACGTAWYLLVWLEGAGLSAALMQCVVPYLLPDLAKLVLAWIITRRLRRFVQRGM
jgi:biotin transport system substrate-specific component